MADGPQFTTFEPPAPTAQGPQFTPFNPDGGAAPAGAQFTPFQPEAPDTRREVGVGEDLTRGYVNAGAQTGKMIGLAFSAPAILFDKLKSAVTGVDTTDASDYAFKHWVDPYQNSIDWAAAKPDEKQTFLGKVANGIGALVQDLPLMIASGGQSAAPGAIKSAAPSVAEFTGDALHKGFDAMRPLMVRAGSEKAEEILNNGGSTQQAIKAGATAAMLAGYTAAAPLSAEGKLLARMVTGVPMAGAAMEIARQAQNVAMPEGMEQKFDIENAAAGAVTGGLMAGAMGHRPAEAPRAAEVRPAEVPVADALQAIRPLGEQRVEAPDAPRAPERVEPTLTDPVKPSPEILNATTVDEAIAAAKVELPNVWRKPVDEVADTAAATDIAAKIEAELPAAPEPVTKRLLGDRGVDAEGRPWEHTYRAAENPDRSFTLERVMKVGPDDPLAQAQRLGKDGTWSAEGEPQTFKTLKWAAEAAMEQKANQPRDGRAAEAHVEPIADPAFDGIEPEQAPRFSAGAPAAGITVPELRTALTTGKLGGVTSRMIDTGRVVLHKDVSTLPEGADGAVEGVKAVTAKDGTIHMVADSLTPETARAVLLHEAFHRGAESLLTPEAWSDLMKRMDVLYRQGGEIGEFFNKAREAVSAARKQGAIRDEHLSEEMAAYAIESYKSAPPGVRRVIESLIGQVKAWALRKFGKQLGGVSEAQLTALAVTALRNTAKSGTASGGRFSVKTPLGPAGAAPRRLSKLAAKLSEIGVIKKAAEVLPKIINELQLSLMPMSARSGSEAARSAAKDYANAERNARWQWAEFDKQLEKNYTPEERQAMWEAADEQNVLLQQGLPTAGKGLDRLNDGQKATMEVLHRYGEELLQRSKDAGMFKGEGLPYWTPRIAVMIGEDGSYSAPPPSGEGGGTSAVGRNLSTNASSLKHRKYLTTAETEAALKEALGENAAIVKDIRTMPMAMARLERAVAARELVNGIKELGRKLGKETVVGEERPDYFTIDHPAFKTFRPRFVEGEDGKQVVAVDQDGNMMFDKVPVYVAREFEGPLKSVLSETSGAIYQGMMNLKGAAMSVIMYSPLIHNMVEFGRALPMMPGKMITLQVYFEGNKVKNDPKMMRFFIDKGMVPIGHRGGIQDITGIMENPELNPGRSWTAKLLGGSVGLVNKGAGQAVKRGVDKAGDFWHNTLLWDRIGDLQAGLAINIYKAETARLMKKGLTLEQAQGTAGYLAAHMANRYAGALPNEAMSAMSRKIGNMALFSRSFTLGNVGVMKDMLSGLPVEVRDQIRRDFGDLAARVGTDVARRKAVGAFIIDVALMYAANSVLQDVFDHWKRDKSWSDIARGYVDRFDHMIHRTQESPLSMLDSGLALGAGGAAVGAKLGGIKGAAAGALAGGVAGAGLKAMEELASTAGNEPGKRERILYDFDKNGTGIYMRMPMGKIGEEFVGWGTSPLDMLKRKESTFTRPLIETFTNDKGFGKRVYNPDDPGVAGAVRNVGKVVANFMKAQIPVDAIQGLMDTSTGAADDTTTYKLVGPLAGLTFSKGAPGGPVVGEMYHTENIYRGKKADLMPTVHSLIKQGKTDEAVDAMRAIGMPNAEINTVLRYSEDPGARLNKSNMRRFQQHSDDDAKERMEKQLNGR